MNILGRDLSAARVRTRRRLVLIFTFIVVVFLVIKDNFGRLSARC
jgi:hypothetical protein